MKYLGSFPGIRAKHSMISKIGWELGRVKVMPEGWEPKVTVVETLNGQKIH